MSDSELEIERDEIPDFEENSDEENSDDDVQSTERMIRNMREFKEIQSRKKVKKNGNNKPKQVYVKLDLIEMYLLRLKTSTTLPFKMFGPSWFVWCEKAVAEVDVSLP